MKKVGREGDVCRRWEVVSVGCLKGGTCGCVYVEVRRRGRCVCVSRRQEE